MKVKSYIAADVHEALLQVKEEIGDGAVILSQQETPKGLLLTVGWDDEVKAANNNTIIPNTNDLKKTLDYHGIIYSLKQQIYVQASQEIEKSYLSETDALTKVFEKTLKFTPLLESKSNIQMFMGTPGSGKSTAIAKVATLAKMKGQNIAIVSTDNLRAGANLQLKSFAEILDVDFYSYKDPQQLFSFINDAASKYQRVLVDTSGINPFMTSEIEKVASFADIFKGDKILITDAGRNVDEAVEVAEIFKGLGAQMLLPTRLDLTRRLGAIISISGSLDLAICGAAVSSSIAKGFVDINAKTLAMLLVGHKDN